jgi:hypothetical protein
MGLAKHRLNTTRVDGAFFKAFYTQIMQRGMLGLSDLAVFNPSNHPQ